MQMKKLILLAVFFTLILVGNVIAQDRGFGLGVILGEPTGVSGKLWLSGKSAIDMAAAWSLSKDNELHLHGDYLVHSFNVIKVEKGRLPIYYGIGGRIRFDDGDGDDNIGVRIPVGMAYIFSGAPLDLFLEVVPILDLAPDTDFDMNAALGMRYYF
jgi:hypothetical protein